MVLKIQAEKFWLKVDKIFKSVGMKTLQVYNAFYCLHGGKSLLGMILCHVNDLSISEKKLFVEMVNGLLRKHFTISRVESSAFRFTGIDVLKQAIDKASKVHHDEEVEMGSSS